MVSLKAQDWKKAFLINEVTQQEINDFVNSFGGIFVKTCELFQDEDFKQEFFK